MNFIELMLHPYGIYTTKNFSDEKMDILGSLFSDLGCPGDSLDDWIFDDNKGLDTSGNSVYLEKDGLNIYLSDLYDEDGNLDMSEDLSKKLKISRINLAELIDVWKDKVYEKKPKNVTITYDDDIFTITTSD